MDTLGWIQLALYVVALLAITKPLGLYLCKVLDVDGRTFLDPVLKPLEKLTYKLTGVDPHKGQDWKQYALAMLVFSAVGLLFTYAILRLQAVLPLNPQNLPAVGEHLSFNTAASFTTNTNWQSYGGESTMSYFSQMVALTFHNWVSAATGIAIAAALVRGIARHTAKTIGNFWTDLTRVSLYLLLPICLFYSLFLVSQGMIQNFKPYTSASLVEPFTAQVPKVDDNGQAVTGADGARHVRPACARRFRLSIRRPSYRGRWPRRSRSRCSERTAAAMSMRTQRILSKTRRRSRISCKFSPSSPFPAG